MKERKDLHSEKEEEEEKRMRKRKREGGGGRKEGREEQRNKEKIVQTQRSLLACRRNIRQGAASDPKNREVTGASDDSVSKSVCH